jgi:hypothetical protein
MLKRSHACIALIFCTSAAFAQEISTSSASTVASPVLTPTSTLEIPAVDSLGTPALTGSSATSTSLDTAEAEEGFLLPGGYGFSPLNFTPGQGLFDRQPLSFSTTVQHGYDDNIYSSSGKKGETQPIKGSQFTAVSEGVDLLIAQSRVGLSLQANAGAQYYYDRAGDQLTPIGGLSLLFAYKLTPRAQFSSVINGTYTTQPSLSVLNGLVQSNGKGYLTINGKFDLLYLWTRRISTDTTYTIVNTTYSGSTTSSSDALTQTIGQSVRYLFNPIFTGVAELRASQASYGNSIFDSKSYYLLLGPDVMLSRRLSGSLRAGGMMTEYDNSALSNDSSPYVEASADYILSRLSSVSFSGRYGLNGGNSSSQSSGKETRLGIGYNQTFTPKLRGSIAANYSHQANSSEKNTVSAGGQDSANLTVGAQYLLSQKLTLFANYTHFEVFNTANPLSENSRNTYYVGATYNY